MCRFERILQLLAITLTFSIATTVRVAAQSPSGPVIKSLTPFTTFVGDTVVVKGSGFDGVNLAANKLFFVNSWFVWPEYQYENIESHILAVTDTTIKAIVPLGASTGEIRAIVNGQTATSENPMYYGVRVRIDSFTPGTGYVGDTVTFIGTGFKAGYPAENRVWFTNGNTAAFEATATSIRVVVPATSITGPVKVFTNTPMATTASSFHVLPTLSYLEQTSGRVGEQVYLYGTGFDAAQQSDYQVTFNGTPAEITLFVPGIIRVKVPQRASTGPVNVIYNNTAIKGSGKTYTVIPTTPGITSLTPTSGVIGTPVKISGTAFDQGGPPLTVSFGGVPAKIDSFTNQTIYTKVPVRGRSGLVVVTAGGRDSDTNIGFRVKETVADMQPRNANVGDTIVVSGAGFIVEPSDYYTVTFKNSNESVHPVAVTDTTLKFKIPANAFYSDTLRITSEYFLGISIKLPVLNILPLISRIEPDTVIAGRKTDIRIYGSGFPSLYLSDKLAIIFSPNTIQPVTFSNSNSSFRAFVPQAVDTGVVPVTVRIQDLLSNSINLVVLPDTFPYTPLHPEIFGATDVTTTSFRCFWSKSYRALGYLLDVSDNDFQTCVPGFKALVVTDTTTLVSGLTHGTTYGFRLRPYSDTDTADYQYVEHVITIPLPPVASRPLDQSQTGFTCRWSSVKGAESYYIEASNDFFETFISTFVSDTTIRLSLGGAVPEKVSYRVKAANGWGMSDFSNVITLAITGTEDETAQVSYYPNPAKDEVFISGLPKPISESHLIDGNGKTVSANLSKNYNGAYVLDIRALPDGLYILQLSLTNQKVVQVKFIKR